ncbi:RidA family protein [Elioraea rosea]|uniref:RidA family protein n=1 Tax=Elioraea rosea TaxID=2492390 RepID=UPI001184D8D8|nr:RidA family protein [Elioraea rosea]
MQTRRIIAPDGPQPPSAYAQAVEVADARRWLFVSGQIPVSASGEVPESFEEQARLAWRNVERQLVAAGMTLGNIVKHTTFLSDRKYRDAYRKVRLEVLGEHAPALTVVICDIFDGAWLLEIEAVAAA